MKTSTHLLPYLAQFFLEWEMLQTEVLERIKKYVLCSKTFFFKSCRLWDNEEKWGRAEHATDDKMAHEHHMLDS
jgi:hypothetical protein